MIDDNIVNKPVRAATAQQYRPLGKAHPDSRRSPLVYSRSQSLAGNAMLEAEPPDRAATVQQYRHRPFVRLQLLKATYIK